MNTITEPSREITVMDEVDIKELQKTLLNQRAYLGDESRLKELGMT